MTLEIYAQTRVWSPSPRLIASFAFPFKNLSNNGTGIKNIVMPERTPLAKQKMFNGRNIHCSLPVGDFLTHSFSTFSFEFLARRLIFIRLWSWQREKHQMGMDSLRVLIG